MTGCPLGCIETLIASIGEHGRRHSRRRRAPARHELGYFARSVPEQIQTAGRALLMKTSFEDHMAVYEYAAAHDMALRLGAHVHSRSANADCGQISIRWCRL